MIGPDWFSARQNQDGGWGYSGDSSAVEPTVWAMLALKPMDSSGRGRYMRALKWLAPLQRRDGGWPPRPDVTESTWVTALALLALAPPDGVAAPNAAAAPAAGAPAAASQSRDRKGGVSDAPTPAINIQAAVAWLLSQSGRESSLVFRLRQILIGVRNDFDVSNDGWPWYPGTAAWVIPTALTIIALRKMRSRFPNLAAESRIRAGQAFLFARMCADGGWNHGSSKALGYESLSYPETTGAALLALAGLPPERLARSLDLAETHLERTRSREASSWLQLGLSANGRRTVPKQFGANPRSVQEAALSVLAESALNRNNILLA